MRENLSIHHAQKNKVTKDSFTLTLLNVRSLTKHAKDVQHDENIMDSDVLMFTESQLLSDPNVSIIETLSPFSLLCNNMSNDKFSNIAIAYRQDVALLNEYSIPSGSIYTLSKGTFFNRNINLMLLYRKNSSLQSEFLYMIQQLRDQVDLPHIIVGDFNINALDSEENFLNQYLREYRMIIDSPTHVSGSLIDHMYIHKELFEYFTFDVLIQPVYFSDHDAVKLSLFKL